AVDYLIKPFNFNRFEKALLKYLQKFQLLHTKERIEQAEVDAFLLEKQASNHSLRELPKGITQQTLVKVVKSILNIKNEWFSTKDIAQITGVSRVSVSKYLKYLAF